MGGLQIEVRLPTAEEIESIAGRQHDDALFELERVRRRLESAIAAVIDHADRTAHYLDDDHRNVAAWTRAVTNCSPGESRRRAQTARALRVLPSVKTGLADATLGVDQVRELARLNANPRAAEHLPGSETVLLEAARQLEYADFAVVTKRWEMLADADGAHRDHEASHATRDFSIHQAGSEFVFGGHCGVVQGTALQEIFQRFCDAEFYTDWEEGRARHGAAVAVHNLPRTAAQRRMDAFATMCERAATASAGRMPAPVVNVIVDLDTFEQHLRAALDGTLPSIDPATILDRRCETTDGVAVDPSHVVALALVGQVRRVVLDAEGVIVNASRLTRLYRGPIREALKAIDPRCRWLGCLVRARISAIDHKHEFAEGGATDAANGWILCDRHNLKKSERGYRARRHENGWWIIQRPDGTPLRPPDAA